MGFLHMRLKLLPMKANVRFYIIDSFCSFDEGAGGKVSCVKSVSGKRIYIQLANMKYTDSCIEILQNSDLGRAYFSDYEKAANMLTYAVGQENIYVALDENEKCLGFIYYMTNGVFGSYPYLHIVAVKEEYRNYGIGKQLMKFFEDNATDSSSAKYFLTVDDFNPRAKKLYENLGYKCVGELTDFYKEGINCYLMMKRRG